MRFDVCLMNPPYQSGLHLRFLTKVIEMSDNVVSIEPAEWLARPYIKKSWQDQKEKYKPIFSPRLRELEMLPRGCAGYFDADLDNELGIFVFDLNGGEDYENFYKKHDTSYLESLTKFKLNETLKDKIEVYNQQRYFVPIRKDGNMDRWWNLLLINYLDIIVDGKVYSGEYKGKTISQARASNPHEKGHSNDRATLGISFTTLEEAINFRDSLKTEAYIYIEYKLKTTRSNPIDKLPYLSDYSHKWSNEQIFDLFDIDKSIRQEIVDDMKIFMSHSKNFKYPKFDNI